MMHRRPNVASVPLRDADPRDFLRWVKAGVVRDPRAAYTTADLYDAYLRWLAGGSPGRVPLPIRAFRELLPGVAKARGATSAVRWVGLRPVDAPSGPAVVQAEGLGFALQALRKHAGLGQDDLADLLGVNRTTVQRVERGSTAAADLVASWERICDGKIVYTVIFGRVRP